MQQLLLPGSIDQGPRNLGRFMDASSAALDLPGAGFRRGWPKASGRPGSSSGMQRSRDLNDRSAPLPLPLRQLASHATSTPQGPQGALGAVPAVARSARWTIMGDKHGLREDLLAVVASTPNHQSPVVFGEGRSGCRPVVPQFPDRCAAPMPVSSPYPESPPTEPCRIRPSR